MWVNDSVLTHAFELQKSHDLFELLVEKIYRKYLTPGDYAIDAGCNEGRHTLPLAAAVGSTGIVVGFEPIPYLAERLSNRKDLPQIHIYNKAISSAPGHTSFVLFPGRTGWSGLRRRSDASDLAAENIEVDVTTLDELPIREVSKLRFMKMDIEGGEFDALRGGKTLLIDRKPMVIFENGGGFAARTYGHTIQDWFAFFADIGYRVFDILGRPYTKEFWNGALAPWNSIAVAEGSDGDKFVEHILPDLVMKTMDECVSVRD